MSTTVQILFTLIDPLFRNAANTLFGITSTLGQISVLLYGLRIVLISQNKPDKTHNGMYVLLLKNVGSLNIYILFAAYTT